MPFVAHVASDVFGQKLNIELELPHMPSIPELQHQIEMAFTAEQHARRPGSPSYQVAKIHVVDPVTDDWTELTSTHQLRSTNEHAPQMYVFQPHSTLYTETQGHIPPAVRARTNPPSARPSPVSAATQLSPHSAAPYHAAPPGPAPVLRQQPPYSSAHSPLGGMRGSPVSAGALPSRGYSAPAAVADPAEPVRLLPDEATHDEKVRILFDELDTRRSRSLGMEELRRGFRVAGLDFTAVTSDDLFKKADCDRDGVISYPEWQRFCELYPTLTDSLYFRLKTHYEHAAQEQRCLETRNRRAALVEAERRYKERYDQSQLDADDAARRLNDADRALADVTARCRAAEDSVREGQRGVDHCRQNRAERERDLASERDRERQAQMRIQDSARELEASQRRVAGVQQSLSDAEAAEQRLLQELQEVQREVQRQRQGVEMAQNDMVRIRDRHNQLLVELPSGVEEAAGALARADQDLANAEAHHRELGARLQEASNVVNDGSRQRDEAARVMQQLRDAQEPARLAWIDSQRELEEHDRSITELEAALAADADMRRGQDDQEKGLVEQEIRLREQRESLEEKEQSLREAHSTFFQGTATRSRSPLSGGMTAGAQSRTYAATKTTRVTSTAHAYSAYSRTQAHGGVAPRTGR
eukprot:TRINITY_DN36127_c0_g1_i1.p1 TRINITY_DN36127_c0_g1~~TRINITY_DN36127_c0_g1_i1.p1  ORF type:complete len:644 (+),score=211.60 TRINITY_DN36127_c0_g1_i1:57-1988(+)